MPEALEQTDEQILNITDDAPEVSSEAPETFAPEETTSQEPTEQLQPTSQTPAKDGTLPAKPADKTQTQQPVKPTKDGTQEQPQDIASINAEKAAELDRADQAFLSGDYQGMAETFDSLFGENPHAAMEAMWMGCQFLEKTAPQELAQFSRFVVSNELASKDVWTWLEKINSAAKESGAREVSAMLNQFARVFQGYGLGPTSPQMQEAAWGNYTKSVGALMEQNVDNDIKRAFGQGFASIQPRDQEELLTAARFAVRDLLSKDREITAALQQLYGKYSVNDGVKFYLNVLDPKIRGMVSRVTQHLAGQYKDLFATLPARPARSGQPAPAPAGPKNLIEAYSRGMNLKQILESVQTDDDRAQAGNLLGREEAARMSDRDILDSRRPANLKAKPAQQRTGSLKKSEARNMSWAEILDDERPVSLNE